MKKTLSVLLALAVFSAWTGAVVAAEVGTIEAKISFQFIVGDQTLPAGKYKVEQVDDGDVTKMVIHSDKTGGRAEFFIEPLVKAYPAYETHLVFDVVGGDHFLGQVWIENEETGRVLVREETPEQAAMEHHRTQVSGQHRPPKG